MGGSRYTLEIKNDTRWKFKFPGRNEENQKCQKKYDLSISKYIYLFYNEYYNN